MNEHRPTEPPGRIDPNAVLSWTLTAATIVLATPLGVILWDVVAGL